VPEPARHARRAGNDGALIYRSDSGSWYIDMSYSERPAHAGIELSIDSREGGYDNTLTETINGL
jgi:hypothetical protein